MPRPATMPEALTPKAWRKAMIAPTTTSAWSVRRASGTSERAAEWPPATSRTSAGPASTSRARIAIQVRTRMNGRLGHRVDHRLGRERQRQQAAEEVAEQDEDQRADRLAEDLDQAIVERRDGAPGEPQGEAETGVPGEPGHGCRGEQDEDEPEPLPQRESEEVDLEEDRRQELPQPAIAELLVERLDLVHGPGRDQPNRPRGDAGHPIEQDVDPRRSRCGSLRSAPGPAPRPSSR